ncbi:MAG: DUF4131 domain-containing protein [Lysobacterales bacterium]|nr:MAG: DUF4131 domain-containing protein [Xanthomonadales bacterium]
MKSHRDTVETECKPEVLILTLVSACCAWLLGIYIGRKWCLGSPYLWLIVPLLLVALWLLRKRRSERFVVMLGLLAVLGVLRVDSVLTRIDPGTMAYHNNRLVHLTGTVVGRPDVRETRVELTVEAEELQVDSEILPVHGRVLISTSIYPRLEYGDRLQATGYMQEPPISEDFSYRDFLARQDILSLMYYPKLQLLERGRGNSFAAALYAIREHARSVINRILPYPEAALLSGILLGAYHALPEKVTDSFNATGTSHIIVISGFNITILAIVLLRVSNQWLIRRQAVWLSIAGIVFYTLLLGSDAAVVRAAIMVCTILFAVLVGRASDALTSLALAALLMTAWNPLTLWDVSFQLSAGATLGLVLFASSLYQYAHHTMAGSGLSGSALPLIKDTLIATLAAQVFTLPLILYYFRRLSLVMPVANILILPVQPPLMGSGAIALLAGCVWLPAGQVIGWVTLVAPAPNGERGTWLIKCKCGKQFLGSPWSFLHGKRISCGCYFGSSLERERKSARREELYCKVQLRDEKNIRLMRQLRGDAGEEFIHSDFRRTVKQVVTHKRLNRKLDKQKVREMRSKHSLGLATQQELALAYGVGRSTVCDILNGKAWRNV